MVNKVTLRQAAEQALDSARIDFDYHGNPLDSSDAAVLFAAATLRQALEVEQETKPKKGSYEAVFGHLGMTPDELGNYMITLQMLAEEIVANDVAAQKQDEPVAWLPRDEACLALWQAMHKRADMGNPADDKLVLNHLRQQGLWIGKYAHPQPPRQPLTDEQIARAWAVASGEHNASSSVKRRITRAIERAHGIGGEA